MPAASHPNLTMIAANMGHSLMGMLPEQAASAFGGAVPYIGAFIEIASLWNQIQQAESAAAEQNALAEFDRARFYLQRSVKQSADYLAASAILEEGRNYVGELEDAYLRAGVSARSGTVVMQKARIDSSFKRRALLAREGL